MKSKQGDLQEQAFSSKSDQILIPVDKMDIGTSSVIEFSPTGSKNCIRQASFPSGTPLAPQMTTCPTRQMSLPSQSSSESNGFNPKPLTTSQHHPPKITVLNRSPAVNLSSPTPTDSSSQPSSAEDLRLTSAASFSDDSVGGIVLEPSVEEAEALASARPPLSTDSSFDYKDSSGIDLHEFIVKTLRENPRDRLMLLKLEKDFTGFIRDDTRVVYQYPPMTSYHRMLVHRVAAYFGLDHNIDTTGKCVIVNKNPTTRIPECTFQMYCSREYTDEEISQLPKAILKRANSSEESTTPPRRRSPPSTPKTLEDKKSRSIEEREHEYERARARIFQDQSISSQSSIDSGDFSSNFANIPQMPSVAAVSPDDASRQASAQPHFEDWGEQKNAEREAAIAAAAAATGNEGGHVRYSTPRKQRWTKYDQGQQESAILSDVSQGPSHVSVYQSPTGEIQMGAHQQAMMSGAGVSGVSASGVYINVGQESLTPGSVWMNTASGQPGAAHDQSQVIYQQGYTIGRPMYQGQHPMQSQGTQQASYPYIMPVQYPDGQQQHYYLVQPQADHIGIHAPQEAGVSPHPVAASQIGYHNLTGQLAGMSISHRHHDFKEDDTGSTDSYSTTPTPPPGTPTDVPQQLMMPGNPYVIVPQQRQMVSGQLYQSPVPMQYIPGQGYVTYSPYPQYMTVPDPASRYTQAHTPPVQQPRSPSPIMVGSPYLANPPPGQPQIGRPGPAQTPPFSRTPPPSSGSYIRNTMQGSMPGMIIPMQPSPAASASGSVGGRPIPSPAGHTHWKGQLSRKGGKAPNSGTQEIINYQALAQEGQRIQQNIAFSGHRQPVVKMIQVPHFPLMSGQRFPQGRNPYGQYPNYSQSAYRRGKPRNQRVMKQIATLSSDDEKKTVNHILEVYDMPEGISLSESETLLKELENSGCRILRINNSSVGSSVQSSFGPTVLAIFKSAVDAQNALETVKNPKFKLRVSQKSPTHITADNNVTSKGNNTSST